MWLDGEEPSGDRPSRIHDHHDTCNHHHHDDHQGVSCYRCRCINGATTGGDGRTDSAANGPAYGREAEGHDPPAVIATTTCRHCRPGAIAGLCQPRIVL